MVWTVLKLVASAVLVVIIAFLEFLDWHGRFELIEARYPRIWKLINNRPLRLIGIVVLIVLLSRDFTDAIAVAPPPVIRLVAPPAPNIVVANPSVKTVFVGHSDPAKALAIRIRLAQLLEHNEQLRNSCFTIEPPRCVSLANSWLSEADDYLSKNMEASYRARFRSATGLTLGYNAAKEETSNNAVNTLTWKAAALAEFIKEQR